jgi:hypothetical protein
MLLPTQQTQGFAATSMMQSMLDGIEEQRKQDEEKRTGQERDKVTEAKVSASEEARRAREKIASALFGTGNADANQLRIRLTERLAAKLGMDIDDARSSFKLGRALEEALNSNMKKFIEEELGLKAMGISAETLLRAIQNPYGDDAERLEKALVKAANGGKLDTEVERVVQRMEATANPRTLEELKLGPQGYDPTRVEDEQTRTERRKDIAAAEAGEKLDEVQKAQDVIEKNNAGSAANVDGSGGPESATVGADAAAALITVFAAAAEQVDRSDGAAVAISAPPAEAVTPGDGAALEDVYKEEAVSSEIGEQLATEFLSSKAAEGPGDQILPIGIDDIGLYELLKRKLAA